jgi:lipopolysaccharide transport system ATP-binding protein
MGEVSKGEGRTVLFVSHNMEAMSSLCYSSILLENGSFITKEKTNVVIGKYIKKEFIGSRSNIDLEKIEIEDVQISSISFNGQSKREIEINQGSDLIFSFELQKSKDNNVEILFNVEIKTTDGQPIGCFGNEFQKRDIKLQKEKCRVEVNLGECGWKKGEYSLSVYFQLGLGFKSNYVYKEDIIIINVKDSIFKSNFWYQFINQQQHGLIPIIWKDIKKEIM